MNYQFVTRDIQLHKINTWFILPFFLVIKFYDIICLKLQMERFI